MVAIEGKYCCVKEGFRSPILAMQSKSEETRRAAGKIKNVGAPDGSDYWEGVLERSVRTQPCGPPYSITQGLQLRELLEAQ